jgi:hypothetical protein
MRDAEWISEEFSAVDLGDKRLKRRFLKTAHQLFLHPTESIHEACRTWAASKGAYRLFSHGRLESERMLEAHIQQTVSRLSSQKVILAIQDTTTLGYSTHHQTQGLGKLTSGGTGSQALVRGLLMHTALAVDLEGVPLGLLDHRIWSRTGEDRSGQQRFQIPLQEKESFRWTQTLRKIHEAVNDHVQIVHVGDREADLFAFMHEANALSAHFLVRARQDRRLQTGKGKRLYAFLKRLEAAGKVGIYVPSKGGRPSRQAHLSLRFGSCELRATSQVQGPQEALRVWVIWAKEEDPPKGSVGLDWKLITNLPILSFAEACEKLNWYAMRWMIESFHRVLKSGFQIEACRLQTAERLERYITLMSIFAWRLFWMTTVHRRDPKATVDSILTDREWRVLFKIQQPQRRIPKKPPLLQDAIRWIAQLGGFLGRKHDGQPGSMTLWRGWRKFQDMLKGAEIAASFN